MNAASRVGTGALLLLPGALTVYLSFNAGGFFPNTQAFVAMLLVAALILRIALAESPFEGFGPGVAVAAGALALYALWTLLSQVWSDASSRALLEFDRALLYLLALVLFGSIARTSQRTRVMLWGLAAGIAVVCVCGLVTRVLPELWPISETIADDRLNYPLTYWNSLGLLAAIGVVLCFHVSSSRSELPILRVLAAGLVPMLATTLFFTFSRGAIAAGILGLVTYIVIGRPRALLSGLLSTVPAATFALIAAYDADLLASRDPTSAAAVAQGEDVALVLAVCVAGAMLVRALLLLLDARLARIQFPATVRRRARLAAAGVAVVAVVAGVALSVALDAPGYAGDQYDRFVAGGSGSGEDLRERLTNPANNGRLDEWEVALDGFADAPVEGLGAGMYETQWARERPIVLSVRDAHSLYAEVLGELGVVGIGLLLIALLAILAGFAARTRGPQRTLYAALLAAGVTWTVHAGVDWDWEMPAVTLWLFALGGIALARSARQEPLIGALRERSRVLAIVASASLAIVPALIYASESQLARSADAFERGDCAEAVDKARSASSALGVRPEPHEIIGWCRLRERDGRAAARELAKAVDRDRDNWTYHYGLALARGVAGLDPRPQAREALRLNPLDAEAQELVRRLRGPKPERWRHQSRALSRGAFPFYLSD